MNIVYHIFIIGAKITQACVYDEDCLHTTINSYCHEEGRCACSEVIDIYNINAYDTVSIYLLHAR